MTTQQIYPKRKIYLTQPETSGILHNQTQTTKTKNHKFLTDYEKEMEEKRQLEIEIQNYPLYRLRQRYLKSKVRKCFLTEEQSNCDEKQSNQQQGDTLIHLRKRLLDKLEQQPKPRKLIKVAELQQNVISTKIQPNIVIANTIQRTRNFIEDFRSGKNNLN